MLPKRAVVRNPLQINMALSIGNIYLKEIRTLLFVRMLTLILINITCQKAFKQKKHAHLSSLQHHRSHPTQMSTAPGSKVEGSEEAANKSYIRHSTSKGTSGSMATAEACSCQSEWQTKEVQIKALQEKVVETQ
jgi:hypothetical protein